MKSLGFPSPNSIHSLPPCHNSAWLGPGQGSLAVGGRKEGGDDDDNARRSLGGRNDHFLWQLETPRHCLVPDTGLVRSESQVGERICSFVNCSMKKNIFRCLWPFFGKTRPNHTCYLSWGMVPCSGFVLGQKFVNRLLGAIYKTPFSLWRPVYCIDHLAPPPPSWQQSYKAMFYPAAAQTVSPDLLSWIKSLKRSSLGAGQKLRGDTKKVPIHYIKAILLDNSSAQWPNTSLLTWAPFHNPPLPSPQSRPPTHLSAPNQPIREQQGPDMTNHGAPGLVTTHCNPGLA